MDCVERTQAVAARIKEQDFDGAMLLRGGSFRQSYKILQTVQQAAPRPTPAARRRFRLAVVHGGGPAPGMNTAVRAAVRLGLDRGYTVLAVKNGFRGLARGRRPGDGLDGRQRLGLGRRRRDRHQPRTCPAATRSRRSPNRLPHTGSTAC